MELCKMAQEYRRNTALLELRKKQLLAAKRHAKQYEVKYRLMRRIRTLNEMINESRLAAFEMENYYEKEGERQYDRCAYESYIRDLGQEDSTLRAAFRTAFFEAMRSELTARQYEVLRLETVEGMNGKEVAARLGITQSAVSRHKSRGMKRLRSLLSYNLELL